MLMLILKPPWIQIMMMTMMSFLPAGVPTPPMVMPSPVPGFEPSLTAVSEAQKHARQAASALGFEDVQTAIKNLSDALKLLTQP